ncbi:hypothetical protein [Nostoc commune]|uniref:hypothetical protein n=1 Tax=Nostoc commune TaxID=1178 RepID=UPI0011B25427|nr:hypothetical protein [Nostoc commune]
MREIRLASLDLSRLPFLTQKLCQLVVQVALESYKGTITIPNGAEGYWVEQLVRSLLCVDFRHCWKD